LKRKYLTKFLCSCCDFYQFFELTKEYFVYKFTVIEIDEYRDANGVLSAENFPVISICSHISFLSESREESSVKNSLGIYKYFDMILNTLSYSFVCRPSALRAECYPTIADIIDEEMNVSNDITFINYILYELKFEALSEEDERKIVRCISDKNYIFSKSLIGECFSLFTNFTFKASSNQSIENSRDCNFDEH
jgi:hypothetical protein